MGGTFNPIHYGHLRMAQELCEQLNLNEVLFIPAANPPHKNDGLISAEHRAAMVKIAIESNTRFCFDGRELNRIGASYTIDTLHSLRDELGKEQSLVLFMGSDVFTKFNTWHHWQEIIQLCHIALVKRTNRSEQKHELPKILETFLHNHYTENSDELHLSSAGWITMQLITALDISSTSIRHRLINKDSARYLMPDSVIDYIKQNNLYTI